MHEFSIRAGRQYMRACESTVLEDNSKVADLIHVLENVQLNQRKHYAVAQETAFRTMRKECVYRAVNGVRGVRSHCPRGCWLLASAGHSGLSWRDSPE